VGKEERSEGVLEPVTQDEIAELIESLVSGRDYITYDELLLLLPEAEEHMELLDAILDELINMGVSILERGEIDGGRVDEGKVDETREGKPTPTTGNLENVPADDLLSVYLTEMAQEPLLTHDEEIELARQIELGRQAERAIQEIDYTAEEYARLQAQVEAGQAAREHLGRANTRLVVSVAKRYRGSGVSFPDLIQSGNVGLMRAVDRYDHRTGYRFATYATWWIRQAVTRSLANQGRIIRIPVHMGDRIRKMAQVAQRLEKEGGQRPTPEEIAVEMDESPAKIRRMMRWASRPLSLEQPAGKDGDVELGYFVEDEGMPQPEEMADIRLLDETLETLLSSLTPREARILRLRYGLQDGQTRTLKEVGEKFGLSRERIRQIEKEALAKLRLVAPKYRLRHFLE
jgi:RNA polymerase primary sigma factor